MGVGLYCSFRHLLKMIYHRVGFKMIGREKILSEGPLIIAVNHTSYLDPIAIGTFFPRILTFMARKSLFENYYFGWLIRSLYAFPVARDGDPREALRNVGACLDQNRAVVIFPEGTRSLDGHLLEFEPGIGMISQRNNSPVQPCYIYGTYQAWPKGQKLPTLHPMKVYVGDPIYPKTGLKGPAKRREFERITKAVRDQMHALEQIAWREQ